VQLTPVRIVGLVAGLVAFALLVGLDSPLQRHGEFGARPALAAGVTALMAIWWLTDALPMHWTALVPLVLFPWTGVFGEGARRLLGAALPYLDPYIFLFMGGMGIGAAMQQWNLHRRIALAIMNAIGTAPARLLFGFVSATAFVSLWISNTATAAMMFPIGTAVLAQCEARAGRRLAHYGAAIMLSIAYGANVGGIGTKIGTAPNALFSSFLSLHGLELDFLGYLAVGMPFVAMFLPVVWLALWREGRRDAPPAGAADAVRDELVALGPLARGEKVVLGVFLGAAALWIGAKPLTDALAPHAPWKLATAQVEGGVSMLAAFALLAWPVGATRALALPALRMVPWPTLVLLGGSLSMAAGVEASGLSGWLGEQLAAVRSAPPFAQVLASSLATVALSAIASNVASTAVMLNVLFDSISPDYVTTALFAATIAASCDFALPVGTPPNAIVFASGYVRVPTMARIGVALDLLGALLAAAWCTLSVRFVL
jgi:sodium-dependent dicarboxylate transporter 2/3/5